MRVRRAALVGCLALVAASCSSAPQDVIVGRWDSEGSTAEFRKDRVFKETVKIPGQPSETVEGHYRFVSEDALETEQIIHGDKVVVRWKVVVVNRNELTLTDEQGHVWKLTRMGS
jgi:hypothetical protein